MAGGVFFWEGLLKFIYVNQGVGRFTKLGIPFPHYTATFVGMPRDRRRPVTTHRADDEADRDPVHHRDDCRYAYDQDLAVSWNFPFAATASPSPSWILGRAARNPLGLCADSDDDFSADQWSGKVVAGCGFAPASRMSSEAQARGKTRVPAWSTASQDPSEAVGPVPKGAVDAVAPKVNCWPVADRAGDIGSFEDLAMPLFARLYNFARWLTQDRAAAEDLVQETYMKALRGFSSFQAGDELPRLDVQDPAQYLPDHTGWSEGFSSLSLDSDDDNSCRAGGDRNAGIGSARAGGAGDDPAGAGRIAGEVSRDHSSVRFGGDELSGDWRDARDSHGDRDVAPFARTKSDARIADGQITRELTR